MTEQNEGTFRYSPDEIRRQEFSHRMRGLDEYEVTEFLDTLASQVRTCESERAADRAEIDRLRSELDEAHRRSAGSDADEVTPQAVALFSQAQQVADQLVEEAVQHARDLMTSARNQQREILQHAHAAAENAVRVSSAALPEGAVTGYATAVPEIEYVRTFARVAQVQLRSVLDALAEQVEKLGEVPKLEAGDPAAHGDAPFAAHVEGPPQAEAMIVYPRQRTGS